MSNSSRRDPRAPAATAATPAKKQRSRFLPLPDKTNWENAFIILVGILTFLISGVCILLVLVQRGIIILTPY